LCLVFIVVSFHRKRLLAPERAAVVEHGDPLGHRNQARRVGLGDLPDEGHDRLLGLAVTCFMASIVVRA